jgi:hypothetical protein
MQVKDWACACELPDHVRRVAASLEDYGIKGDGLYCGSAHTAVIGSKSPCTP